MSSNKSRHFTIHDPQEEIRKLASELQVILEGSTDLTHSKAQVIRWSLKQSIRKAKSE